MKKIFLTSIAALLLICVMGALFVACTPDDQDDLPPPDDTNNPPDGTPDADDEYILTIEGFAFDAIEVKKSVIKELFLEKPVVVEESAPVYAADKTDNDGNPIPHWLKGVYLDDLLALYDDEITSADFASVTLMSADSYEMLLGENTFNPEKGGSKIIIAFEYDGITLKAGEPSGALRAVVPNQAANSWAKALKKIIFGNSTLEAPIPEKIEFMEFLSDDYLGEYTGRDIVYIGYSVEKLLDGLFTATETDRMYLTAWDYENDEWKPYFSAKSYAVYHNAYFLITQDGEIIERAPLFNGDNVLWGMTVKNTMAAVINDTALVSLQTAFTRYGAEGFLISELLGDINVDTDNNFTVITTDGGDILITGAEMAEAFLSVDNGAYILSVKGLELSLKSIYIN